MLAITWLFAFHIHLQLLGVVSHSFRAQVHFTQSFAEGSASKKNPSCWEAPGKSFVTLLSPGEGNPPPTRECSHAIGCHCDLLLGGKVRNKGPGHLKSTFTDHYSPQLPSTPRKQLGGYLGAARCGRSCCACIWCDRGRGDSAGLWGPPREPLNAQLPRA